MSPKITGVKRKREQVAGHSEKLEEKSKDNDERPLCKYGESCYQKNPNHINKFRHPHKEAGAEKIQSEEKTEATEKDHGSSLAHADDLSAPVTKALPGPSIEDEKFSQELGEVTPSEETSAEDLELPPSPRDIRENIQQKFLVEMPDEFYSFWEFCCLLDKENPREALSELLGLKLVGPFELLDASKPKEPTRKLSHYLTTWRFYYDPPEFQCVLVGDLATGYHIGYFRDSPKEMPAFVGYNLESDGSTITPLADSLFGAISHLVNDKLKKADPFNKSKLGSLKKKLEDWAAKNNIPIDPSNPALKRRKRKVVAKTFYQCGIVVPVDAKNKVGYREIPETDSNIKKICQRIVNSKTPEEEEKNSDALQELVTYVQYANDEMDYGMGLELGLDLLAFGGEVFHSTILHLLTVAYELLERNEYATILKAHLANRKKLALKHTEV